MPKNLTPLQALIADAKREHGLSYADVAARGGDVIGRSTVAKLATRELQSLPDPATIKALALGLGVDESAVFTAAGRSLGINVEPVEFLLGDERTRAIVAGVGQLSREDRVKVASEIERIIEEINKPGVHASP